MTFLTENHALKRLSAITWRSDGDGFITMEGSFTPAGAKSLLQQLGDEGRQAISIAHAFARQAERRQGKRRPTLY